MLGADGDARQGVPRNGVSGVLTRPKVSSTFAVRLHATGCSLRETQAILRLFGVQRSHQAIFQWVHRVADSVPDPPEAQPKRVAVDETAVKINGEWSWLYAAIDLDNKLILGVDLFGSHGTDPAAAFLHGLSEKHDLSDGPQKPWFLVCPQDVCIL